MKDSLPIKVELMAQSIETIKNDIADMKKSHAIGMEEIKKMITDHATEENQQWSTFMASKANKWVERAVTIAIIGIVAAAGAFVWNTVTSSVSAPSSRKLPYVVDAGSDVGIGSASNNH